MLDRRVVPTQDLSQRLITDGFAGILVRSFAKGATEAHLNLVLWRWEGQGLTLGVTDDEGRLGRL